jgi:ribonuclease-3
MNALLNPVYIYNKKNIYITVEDIKNILKKGGITHIRKQEHIPDIENTFRVICIPIDDFEINNLQIWQEAFVHRSYCNNQISNKSIFQVPETYILNTNNKYITECIPIQTKSNETMEWRGDGNLKKALTNYLHIRFPYANEGTLTKRRIRLEKTAPLAQLALYLNLDKYIIMARYVEESCDGRSNPAILENTLESFLGAFHIFFKQYATGDEDRLLEEFVINIIEAEIDMVNTIVFDDNYKHQLMVYYQQNFLGKIPKYEQVSVIGQTNNRVFHMSVLDTDNNVIGEGKGGTIKKAEQLAAKQGLKHFNILFEI